ncbi:MAG TPA: MOSC domain-containing protein [Streptosporangiaceae bacterium]|nr:MOSC domain-containing protein [Streptosporangiaceae bacterium]
MRSTVHAMSASFGDMPGARVISVNRGQEADLLIGGRPARSAIDKRPASGPVEVGPLGLDGDTVADKVNHGGLEQAVYTYAREDLDFWTEQLSRELRNGMFGENITTAGIDVSAAQIGETWRVGSVVLQVTAPRIPCTTFKAWMDEEPGWVKRFAAARRPGAYLRVLTPGTLTAGDDLVVLSRPDVAVTVAESMQAYYGDRELMGRLVAVEGRGAKWDEIAAAVLSPL